MNIELNTNAVSDLPQIHRSKEIGRDFTPLASSQPGKPAPAQPNTLEDVAEEIKPIKEAFETVGIELKFSRDDSTNTIVVEMLDQDTGEILRQIPNETMLHLSAALGQLQGNLFNRRA